MKFAVKSGYLVKSLKPSDADDLQQLYEKCADFSYLVDGQPPSPTAAHEEFFAVPDGKRLDDKFMLGLFTPQNELIGLIESIRGYPDDETWWIGLIMLAPEYRGQGLLNPLAQELERWVASHGIQYIMGSVVEENIKVLRLWKRMGFEVIRQAPPRQFGQKTHSLSIIRRTISANEI